MKNIRYLDVLVKAVKEIYREEYHYFNPIKGCEQAIEFRIAHKMANLIESQERNVYVDCEVRKCNGILKIGTKRPDIVVHERQNTGYLVIEIKCNAHKRDWNNDFKKLEIFTLKNKSPLFSKDVPTYELGMFVNLTDVEQDVQVRLYENGEIITDKYPYDQILKGFKHA